MFPVVKDARASRNRAVAAGQQLELIVGRNREEKGDLDRDRTAADELGDGTAVSGIGPCKSCDRPEGERRDRARCIGDQGLRRAGARREGHGEAGSIESAHRPTKDVRAGGLPKPSRHLNIEQFQMRAAFHVDTGPAAIDVGDPADEQEHSSETSV